MIDMFANNVVQYGQAFMEDAWFACFGKLFQTLVPLYEKHFCPFDAFFFGIRRSDLVFHICFELELPFTRFLIRLFGKRKHRFFLVCNESRIIKFDFLKKPAAFFRGNTVCHTPSIRIIAYFKEPADLVRYL